MAKKRKYPSAPTYKRVKGHNKTKSAKIKGFDIKRIKAGSNSKRG